MIASKIEAYLQQKESEKSFIRVKNLQEITDGWETEIYSFDLESDKDGKKCTERLVIRLYTGPWAKEKADTEFNLLLRLHRIGYPVPKVSLLEEDASYLDKPFIVMERIEGQQMWSLLGNDLDDSALFEMFSRLFYDIHNLDWRKLVHNPERFWELDSETAVLQWIEKYEGRAKKLDSLELLEIVDWLKREMVSITFEELSITHNDFHPNNILIDETGNPFVIDWTAASLHDYRVDIAWTLILAKIYVDDSMREAILKGYEKVSQKKIDNLHFFEVIGTLRRITDILVSLESDSENIGLRNGAAEMIREQLPQNMTLLDIVKNHTGLELPQIRKLMIGAKV